MMKIQNRQLLAASVMLAGFFGAALVLPAQDGSDAKVQPADESEHFGGGGGGGWGGGGTQATYGGRATVVNAFIADHRTIVADTGELPATGGSRDATVLDVNVPNVLTAQVAHAVTNGANNRTRSEASLEAMNMNVAGVTMTADLVAARSFSACTRDGASARGRSTLVNLTLNGAPVTVTGEPNQMIDLPGVGHIVINEQIRDTGANAAMLTVNALHVVLDNVADVIVSHADSNIGCTTSTCNNNGDSVHGCGWINTTGTGRGRFGVAAGSRTSSTGGTLNWGHIGYIDTATNLRVRGMMVTSYTVTGATSRRIQGNADVNGQQRTFTVDVADNGDDGATDTFAITLSNGYSASGTLAHGNIQLHEPCK